MSEDGPALVVDRELCCGGGACVLSAPEVFDQDEEGLVVLLQPEPPREFRGSVREAAQSCPVSAIRLIESEEGPR